jgi:hypothetical protein
LSATEEDTHDAEDEDGVRHGVFLREAGREGANAPVMWMRFAEEFE